MSKTSPALRRWLIGYLLTINAILLGLYFFGSDRLFSENRAIENVQAGALLLAVLLLWATQWRRRGFERWLGTCFAVTCLTLLLREVDVEDLKVHAAIRFLGSGIGRDVLLTGLFAYLLACGAILHRDRLRSVPRLFASPVARLSIAGSAMFVGGWLLDRVSLTRLEELFEADAALLILAAAALFVRNVRFLTGGIDGAEATELSARPVPSGAPARPPRTNACGPASR